MHDLVIRDGTVVDGTGSDRFRADVAVDGDRITEVGRVPARGRQEVDAEGHVVTPGFIDGHAHMDAQVFWDPLGSSSCWHGVTTVVMGNCGFTLAPARPDRRDLVIRNLDRAEDISRESMVAGIEWTWETFPQYLDSVERVPKVINYAGYVGHSALRTWAMGERAFDGPASEDDIRLMARELEAAIDAGAMGFTTSRSSGHQTSTGQAVASRLASWEEVVRLVDVMRGGGIFELALDDETRSSDPEVRRPVFDRLGELAIRSQVPMTFGVPSPTGDISRWLLEFIDDMAERGGRVFGQSHCREMLILSSFLTQLPFDPVPKWRQLRLLPLPMQRRLLADRQTRRPFVEAAHAHHYVDNVTAVARPPRYDHVFLFDGPFPPYRTVAEVAQERHADPVDVMIDLALASDFRQLFAQVGANRDPEDVLRVLRHPRTVMTFSDTGAHVGQIIDCSLQTYLLSYWVRVREAFRLEDAVRMVTEVPAEAWGFTDRGRVAPGFVADLNVVDAERVGPTLPLVVRDLPGGGVRLIQRAEGIRATLVGGHVVFEDGRHTGALPGRLLRRRGARLPRPEVA